MAALSFNAAGILPTDEDDDDTIAAEIAEMNAAEDAAIAAAFAARRKPDTAEAAFVCYAAECLSRARDWAFVHAERAAARDLPAGECAFVRVAEILSRLQEAIEERGFKPRLIWIARRAYDAAFSIIEREKGGWYPEAKFHQLVEVEESPIRALCWAMVCIADRRWQLSEGYMTATEAQLAAANDLLAAPLPLLVLDEDGAP